LIIARLTSLLLCFSFHYNNQNGGHYLDIDIFIPVGQRGLSFSKNEVFRKNCIFFKRRRAKQGLKTKPDLEKIVKH